jgi:LRR receptor-like serine/threonine-protein kinase FLS2
MALVHSLGRMHRDLKSGNVLATAHMGPVSLKVADFGTVTLAGSRREKQHTTEFAGASYGADERAMTKGIGTPLWMAPEILAGQPYGISVDVYSYAILLWEIAAQAKPWEDLKVKSFFQAALLKAIDEGRRPPVDPGWPSDYVALMKRCWARDPLQRPTFTQIVEELMTGSSIESSTV